MLSEVGKLRWAQQVLSRSLQDSSTTSEMGSHSCCCTAVVSNVANGMTNSPCSAGTIWLCAMTDEEKEAIQTCSSCYSNCKLHAEILHFG